MDGRTESDFFFVLFLSDRLSTEGIQLAFFVSISRARSGALRVGLQPTDSSPKLFIPYMALGKVTYHALQFLCQFLRSKYLQRWETSRHVQHLVACFERNRS